MRRANQKEIEKIAKLNATVEVAKAELGLALATIRQACGAPPSHTVFEDETGEWMTPQEAQRRQARQSREQARAAGG